MTLASLARRTAGTLPLLASSVALAHPGHDTAPAMGVLDFLLHLLSQPDHLGALAAAVVIGVLAAGTWRAARSSRRR